MGRVKKTRKRTVELNKLRIMKRWSSTKDRLEVCVSPQPSTSKQIFEFTSNVNIDKTPDKRERPKGFELTDSYKTPIEDIKSDAPTYCLMDLTKLTTYLEGLPCKYCLNINSDIRISNPKGFAQEIFMHCNTCDQTYSFETSQKVTGETSKTRPPYDVNRRIIKTFISLGKGYAGLETLSMGMNMPCIHHSAYDKQIIVLQKSANQQALESMKRARVEVEKAYAELTESLDMPKPIDIAVSYDGSWQKRGFTSKYGIGCIIELITGLVIDYEILCKYCRVCAKKNIELDVESDEFQEWMIGHQSSCQANFDGSSPAMEAEAAVRMWQRSEELGFRYTSVVSDGDSKTYDQLTSLNIYGEEAKIVKQECVNHISKRLGTGLRKLVQVSATKNITLGGKTHGSLKGPTIEKLTKYYRNAIINNLENTQTMKAAIFATIDHCRSSDVKPLHNKCPTGKESWCFYQRDKANGINPRKHQDSIKTPLNETVVRHMMPLYLRLSSDELLQRCTLGKTQNANEALHGLIWSKCPKTIFTGKARIEAGIAEGISIYNEGYVMTMTMLLEKSGVSPGRKTVDVAKKKDEDRLRLRKARSTEKYKKYRKAFQYAKKREEDAKRSKEGVTYEPGSF